VRAFSERLSQRWNLSPRGGHFAALERPERLLEDIRTLSHRFDRRAPNEERPSRTSATIAGTLPNRTAARARSLQSTRLRN